MTPGFVFVSHADSGDVHTLALDADGGLRPASTVTLGGTLMPMALSPCGRWLYVARRSEPLAVVTLAIDAFTGQLQALGEAALPGSMACVSTDPSGRWLFAASYPASCVSVSPIADSGIAGAVQQIVPTPPHAHCIVSAPDNRHVLATSLGGDQVLQFRWDATTGQLSRNTPPAWPQRRGAGPRHLRFHPNGRFVYLLNELDATLDVLAFDAAAGTLAHVQTAPTVPPGFSGPPSAADLHLTPDGRWLYTSERTSSTLAAFAVDAGTGGVEPRGHTATETCPRGFAITPDGQHLLAVGQLSHHLSRYRIHPASGSLTLQQRLPMGQNPNWITFSHPAR
jgi:6-phosphogluconolactonase